MSSRPALDPDALIEHAAFVRHVARAALRGDDLVDDVVQDTMLAALQATSRPRGPVRAWLGGVARMRARNLVRQRMATRTREARASRPVSGEAVDDVLARAEVGRRLAAAVVSLDEPYRRAVLMRYFDGLAPREMARALDLPVETARTHVKRGLAQLRTRLESTHEDAPGGWRAALLPLASSPLGLAGTTTAASLGGMLMGKKALAVGAALAALVGAGVWLRPWDEKEADPALEVDAGPLQGDGVSSPSLVGLGPAPAASVTTQAPAPTGFAHIDVEVVDIRGQPLANVPVRLQTWDRASTYSFQAGALGEMVDDPYELRGHDIGRQVTRDGGRTRFERLDPTVEYRVLADPGPPLVMAAARGIAARDGLAVVRLRLGTGTPLRLRVVGPDGQHAPAVVSLVLASSDEDPSARWSSGPCWTDAAGSLRLAGVPAGTFRADVLLPGVARRTGVLVHAPATAEVIIHLRDEPGATLHGRVRDAAGHPVAGARIVAHSGSQHTFEPMTVRSVETDASGAYRIDGLPPGTLLGVECGARGLVGPAPLLLRRELRSGESLQQDFVLAPGCTIRGHVRTSAGDAIPTAYVDAIVRSPGSGLAWQGRATCDADGAYELGSLPAGAAELSPRAAGFVADLEATTVSLGRAGDAHVVELELTAGTPLEGVVLDEDDRPIAGATLTLHGPSTLWKRYPAFEVVATDAEGRFRFPGLPEAKQYEVRLRAGDAYRVQHLTAGTFHKLRVPTMGELHGRVVWEGGPPPGAHEVIVRRPGGGDGRGRGGGARSVSLAADDTFVVRGLEALPIEVLVQDCFNDPAGQALTWDVAPGQVIRDVELHAGPFLEVAGRVVHADGAPRAGVTVTLTELTGQHRRATRRSDAEGGFHFVRVPVGGYRVTAEGSDDAVEVHDDARALRFAVGTSQRITRGVITFSDGTPVPRGNVVHVVASAGGRTSWQMHPVHAGGFEIATEGDLEALLLRVDEVYELDGTRASVRAWRGTHVAGEPLRIVLDRLPHVRGVVVDDSGAPIPGVRLAAQVDPTGSSGLTQITSDAQGRFTLGGVEAGQRVRITPQAVPEGFAMPMFEPVLVGEEEIRLVIPRGGAEVRGRVVDEAGEPVAGVQVFGAFRGAASHAVSDERGAFTLGGLPSDASGSVQARPRSDQPYGTARVADVSSGARDVVLRLPARAMLQGRVVGDLGQGAQLVFRRPTGGATYASMGSGGTFRIAVSGDGEGALVLVDASSNQFGLVEHVVPPRSNLEITLQPGHVIEGVVEGETTAGTTHVSALGTLAMSSARLGGDGRFRIAGLPPGRYTLEVWMGDSAGSRVARLEGVEAGATNVRLRVDDTK
ncbi:MAG: sigma-70 family RNA polymerase sigma factor [Planctomycetota bacterium]